MSNFTPDGINYIGESATAPSVSLLPSNSVYKNTSNGFYYARGTINAWDLYFWPPYQATPGGVSRDITPRVKVANFGDGYKQRSPDGINNIVDNWELSWDSLHFTDSNWIDSFFSATQGLPFRWTPTGSSVIRKYVAIKWSATRVFPMYESFKVSLERDFSP